MFQGLMQFGHELSGFLTLRFIFDVLYTKNVSMDNKSKKNEKHGL